MTDTAAPLLRIVRWETVFMNNRTRAIKVMTWVAWPIDFGSYGFRAIMKHEEGLRIYACFNLMVQIAATAKTRGVLLRSSGVPWTAKSLSGVSTGTEQQFQHAIDFLLSEAVGWLEVVDIKTLSVVTRATEAQASADVTQAPAGSKQSPSPTGHNRTGHNTRERSAKSSVKKDGEYHIDFVAWWCLLPSRMKKSKWYAFQCWQKAVAEGLVPRFAREAILTQINAKHFTRQDGTDETPHAATWLNRRRWQDEIEVPKEDPKREQDAKKRKIQALQQECAERLYAVWERGVPTTEQDALQGELDKLMDEGVPKSVRAEAISVCRNWAAHGRPKP